MIDELNYRVVRPSSAKVAIAYLYCDYRDQKAQTLVPILGTLLQQFLSRSSIPHEVRDTLENIKKARRTPNKNELVALLQITLRHTERAFICIDALDELDAKTRGHLLQEINILVAHTNILRIFLTGRKHIESEVQKLSRSSVEITAHPDDIRSYLKREIADDENPESMDEGLQKEIVTSLVERSQQMYVTTADFMEF